MTTNKKLLQITTMGLTSDRTTKGYGYKYAPLNEVVAMLKEPLEKVGLGYYFTLDGSSIMITVSDIENGEDVMESTFPILEAHTNQDLGKAITYGKRYLLKTVFNISEVDDVDDEDLNKELAEARAKKTNPKVLKSPGAAKAQDPFFS